MPRNSCKGDGKVATKQYDVKECEQALAAAQAESEHLVCHIERLRRNFETLHTRYRLQSKSTNTFDMLQNIFDYAKVGLSREDVLEDEVCVEYSPPSPDEEESHRLRLEQAKTQLACAKNRYTLWEKRLKEARGLGRSEADGLTFTEINHEDSGGSFCKVSY